MSLSEKAVILKTKNILFQFFTSWQNEDWDSMGDACQSSWREFIKKTRIICRHCKHFDYENIKKKNDDDKIGFSQCLLLNSEKSEIQSCKKFEYKNGLLDGYVNERLIEWFGEKKLTAFNICSAKDITMRTNKDLEKENQKIRFEALYRVETSIKYIFRGQEYRARVFVNVISEDDNLGVNPSTVLREKNRIKSL